MVSSNRLWQVKSIQHPLCTSIFQVTNCVSSPLHQQPQGCLPHLRPGSSRLWWSCPGRRSRASHHPPTSHMSLTACGSWGFCHTCPSVCPRCGCCHPWRHWRGNGTLGFWAKRWSNSFAQHTQLLHQVLPPSAPEDSRVRKSIKDNFLFWLKIRERPGRGRALTYREQDPTRRERSRQMLLSKLTPGLHTGGINPG